MRSRHKRTNNEHGHFTIINYMQKKTQRREIIAWIWAHSLTKFAFPACNSSKHCMYVCLLFWASLYAICTHVCSYLILARIKKVFLHTCLSHCASKRKKENHQFQKKISQITLSYPNMTISYQFWLHISILVRIWLIESCSFYPKLSKNSIFT